MSRKSVRVFAPATVSNLGCGFDIFGLAIDQPGDIVEAGWNRTSDTVIRRITGDKGLLPLDAGRNTAGVAVQMLLQAAGERRGVEIRLHKRMPLGSGLGSSAASAVAAVVAVNRLLGNPFTRHELVPFAMEGERVACGSAHADNAAPSLLGGIILIRSLQPPEFIELPVPRKLKVVVVHPHTEVLTREARAALGKSVSLSDATQQWANTAAFVAALYASDTDLLGRAVTDRVAEPVRAPFIPGFYDVKEAALSAGAIACSISGSGPSVFALCTGDPDRIAAAMKKAFRSAGLRSDVFISKVNARGARFLA
jgi:homoserine kinase